MLGGKASTSFTLLGMHPRHIQRMIYAELANVCRSSTRLTKQHSTNHPTLETKNRHALQKLHTPLPPFHSHHSTPRRYPNPPPHSACICATSLPHCTCNLPFPPRKGAPDNMRPSGAVSLSLGQQMGIPATLSTSCLAHAGLNIGRHLSTCMATGCHLAAKTFWQPPAHLFWKVR